MSATISMIARPSTQKLFLVSQKLVTWSVSEDFPTFQLLLINRNLGIV